MFKTVKLGIEIVINHTIRLKPQEQNGRFNANFVSLTDTPKGPKAAILKLGGGINRGYLFNIEKGNLLLIVSKEKAPRPVFLALS